MDTQILSDPVKYFTETALKELLEIFLSLEISFSQKFKTFFKSFLQTEFKNIDLQKLQRVKILLFIFQSIISIISIPIYILRILMSLFLAGEILDVILYILLLLSYIAALLPTAFILYKSVNTLINILFSLTLKIIL